MSIQRAIESHIIHNQHPDFEETRRILENKLADRQYRMRHATEASFLQLREQKAVRGQLKHTEHYFDPLTGKFVVALVLNKDAGVSDPIEKMVKEVEMLKKLAKGPFVPMALVDNLIHFEEEGTVAIIKEKMDGDLYDVKGSDVLLEDHNLLVLFNDIAKGIYYLHSNNFVHRDIKLENVLIKWRNLEKNNLEKVRIDDFDKTQEGLKKFPDDKAGFLKFLSKTKTQTLEFLAPEERMLLFISRDPVYNEKIFESYFIQFYGLDANKCLLSQKEGVIHALQKREMFSLGFALYEAITGKLPYLLNFDLEGSDEALEKNCYIALCVLSSKDIKRNLEQRLAESSIDRHLQKEMVILIEQCLSISPKGRPTAEEFYSTVQKWITWKDQ